MCLRIWPAERSNPMPKPSTPALLLIVVRFFTPLRTRARIRFSGMPHRPKPPTMMLAPSGISRTASSALATTLFIRGRFYFRARLRRKRHHFHPIHFHHRGHRGAQRKPKADHKGHEGSQRTNRARRFLRGTSCPLWLIFSSSVPLCVLCGEKLFFDLVGAVELLFQ